MAKADMTGALQKLKDRKARVRFVDQQARVSQDRDPARPRWTAFVQGVFGHDAVGEGATKEAAARAAIAELPPHIRRHFEGAALGGRAPKRKPLGYALDAFNRTRDALYFSEYAVRKGACAEAGEHFEEATRWFKLATERGSATPGLRQVFAQGERKLGTCKAPKAKRKSWFRRA